MTNQHVLIIGTIWVEPNSSAAGGRMLQLIELFLTQGWKITYASASQKNENAIDLQSIHVDEVSIELNSATFDVFIKELNPTMVVFDRFITEEQFGWRVAENCPNALRVLDTEDLHSLRKTRQECIKKNVDFSLEDLLTSDISKREIASILRCDVSLIISSYEMNLLTSTFKIDENLLYHLPFLLDEIDENKTQNWKTYEERNHFIFIGNFLHTPNVDAVLQLKNHIWKHIKKKLPKTELHIYGAYSTQQIQELHNPKEGFIIKGFAENAKEVVENARIVLAPLRFGAGIKGKLTEAMICGTPSITTSIGAEGMHTNLPWNGCIEDDFATFSKKAISLYADEILWKKMQQNGIEIINKIYDRKKIAAPFINKIIELQENLKNHRTHNFLGNLLQHHTLQSTKYMSKWIEAKNSLQ